MPRGTGGKRNKARTKGTASRRVTRKSKRLSVGKDVVPLSDFINPAKKLREILRRNRSKK